MCGIVGLITKKSNGMYGSDLDLFQAMLVNDSQRGEDSTGVISVLRDGTAETIKLASHPFNLFACDAWDRFRGRAISTGRILVGHNRKATQGAITSENAHPFHEGKIILVHNGTLNNHRAMGTGKEVDSHAIACLFNEKGHEEVIPTLQGAFALVWYNLEEERLYMVRNEQRPLALVETKDTIAFASEGWMAAGQFLRKNETITKQGSVPAGTLLSFDLTTGECTEKTVDLWTPPKVTTTYTSTYTGRNSSYVADDLDYEDTELKKHTGGGTANDRAITSPFDKLPGLTAGRVVQIKINQIRMTPHPISRRDAPKFTGVIQRLGKADVDCSGWLPETATPEKWPSWIALPAVATISYVVDSLCGPSVQVIDVQRDISVSCHESEVGDWTWGVEVVGHDCTKCGSKIEEDMAPFTSVKMKSGRVICHKCIENSLEGERKDEFVKRRDAALENGQSISNQSGGATNKPLQLQGPTTIQ